MLAKIIFVALIGICYGNFFKENLRKLKPIQNSVEHFSVEKADVENLRNHLLSEVRDSLLLKGIPALGQVMLQQTLPLFVSVSCGLLWRWMSVCI
jgi:hypothetical protein